MLYPHFETLYKSSYFLKLVFSSDAKLFLICGLGFNNSVYQRLADLILIISLQSHSFVDREQNVPQ